LKPVALPMRLRTLDLLVVVLGASLCLAWAMLGGDEALASPTVLLGLKLGTLTLFGVAAVRLVSFLMVDVAVARGWRKKPSSLLRLLVSAALYAGVAMFVLKYGLGQDIGGLLGASAVIGAVAGFAMQATLENLFAGVSLQLEQPFALGQVVRIGDTVGEVEALTWRAVHLRTEGRSRVVVPNSVVGSDAVEVLAGDGELVERTVEIDVDPHATPGHVIELIEGAVRAIPNVAGDPPPEVFMAGVRPQVGTRIYEVQYFPIDFIEFEGTEALIRRRSWYALDRAEISCAPLAAGDRGAVTGMMAAPTANSTLARAALAAHPFFTGMSTEQSREVRRGARVLRFTDGEPIGVDVLVEPMLFIVLKGTINRVIRGGPGPRGRADEDSAANLAAWSARDLTQVTNRLAARVGPVADLLVRRAARKTVDLYRLHQLLAEEIHDVDVRKAFLRGRPDFPSRRLEPGDSFGDAWVQGGPPPDLDDFHAVTEAILLAIPRSYVREVLGSEESTAPSMITPTPGA